MTIFVSNEFGYHRNSKSASRHSKAIKTGAEVGSVEVKKLLEPSAKEYLKNINKLRVLSIGTVMGSN